MTREQFDKAMEIIVRYSTTRIGINMSEEGPANNVGKDALRLHITECRPSVINRLIRPYNRNTKTIINLNALSFRLTICSRAPYRTQAPGSLYHLLTMRSCRLCQLALSP